MLYLISYDLMAPGKDYDGLYEALEGIGAKRVLRSVWVVRWSNTSAKQVRDWVKKHTDSDDRLLVGQIDADWATFNAINKISRI